MRIISLNTWGGRAGKENLLSFFRKHADTTDIFCLQEIWSAPYEHLEGVPAGGLALQNDAIMTHGLQDICDVLPDHLPLFRPHHGDHYGLVMMVKKSLPLVDEGEQWVYKERGYVADGDIGNHARNIQYVTVESGSHKTTIINFHGLWTNAGEGVGKQDNPDRIVQSTKILAFIKTIQNPVVLCGDFNLLPNTKSIKLLEEGGLRNLIREYGVTSTRTNFYTKPVKFADYVFISSDVLLKQFGVLPDQVSDHAPLLIDIEH